MDPRFCCDIVTVLGGLGSKNWKFVRQVIFEWPVSRLKICKPKKIEI